MNIPPKAWNLLKRDKDFVTKLNDARNIAGLSSLTGNELFSFTGLLQEIHKQLNYINGEKKGTKSFNLIKKSIGNWYLRMILNFIGNKIDEINSDPEENKWKRESLRKNLDFEFSGTHHSNAKIAIICLGEEEFKKRFKEEIGFEDLKKQLPEEEPPTTGKITWEKQENEKPETNEKTKEKKQTQKKHTKAKTDEQKVNSILDDEDGEGFEKMERD